MSTKYFMRCIEMKRKLIDSNNVLEGKKLKTDNIEPDFLNYISVSPLKNIAIVNVATALCKQSHIRDTIRQHSLQFDPVGGSVSHIRGTRHDESFNQLEKSILHKLSVLPLPNPLKSKVADIIRPIELQILEWIRYDRKDIEYIDSICWTTDGTIDKIKTLKQLIDKDTGQHIHSNFKLACIYCLEKSIPYLWDKLPEEIKNDYLCSKGIYKKYDNHLIAYWTHAINNQLSELFSKIKPSDYKEMYNCNHSLYNNMFTLALSEGNGFAIKYFWNKLTDIEISNNLTEWVNNVMRSKKNYSVHYQDTNQHSDIMYFLLSKMINKEQQGVVLQQNSDVILNSLFADWPWQRFLLPTIQRMWNFLDEKVYITLLNNITMQIKEGKTTEQLFGGIWHNSPINLKKYFIQHILNSSHGTDVLCNLLVVKDIGTIIAILHYANVEEYKQIIFTLTENSKLPDVIYAGRLPLFSIIIEVLSESDINHIKERIAFKHGDILCHKLICDDNWNMVDNFLNWALISQDQIDNFKSKVIDKIKITDSLLHQGNYELVNKFIGWCFDSEQEINQFKIYFAKSKPKIIEIGYEDWSLFEKFIGWCFGSEQEINDFKSDLLQSNQMQNTIFSSIVYGYNFEFIDKLISWCCHSNEEIKQYKTKFVFSREWIEILERFVKNYKVYNSEWNNWELTKKLMKLFSPLELDVITKLKEVIETYIEFDGLYRDCCEIEKEDLFRLLDNDSYDGGSSDSDYTCSDNDQCRLNYFDKDSTTVLQVLNDILSRVENVVY